MPSGLALQIGGGPAREVVSDTVASRTYIVQRVMKVLVLAAYAHDTQVCHARTLRERGEGHTRGPTHLCCDFSSCFATLAAYAHSQCAYAASSED